LYIYIFNIRLNDLFYKLICEPSQYGGFLVCLQRHIAAVLVSSALKTLGVNSLPACAPLHQGWFSDLPHEHHAYVFPHSNCSICGTLPSTLALSIVMSYLNVICKFT
jgi:hypothetical protein